MWTALSASGLHEYFGVRSSTCGRPAALSGNRVSWPSSSPTWRADLPGRHGTRRRRVLARRNQHGRWDSPDLVDADALFQQPSQLGVPFLAGVAVKAVEQPSGLDVQRRETGGR